MDQSGSKLWEDMLEEFRALGGTADNVCLREGRYGRGLFPIHQSKPVKVRIPESLLVESKHVSVVNGNFSVDAAAPVGAREKSFLENYQREFSWGMAHHETEGLLQMFHAAPVELRELLRSPFNLDPWLAGPTLEAVWERFLTSRIIQYKDKGVIMPIVELANHGRASNYDLEDGVGLSGVFEEEVLVLYNHCDPLRVFQHWGFVSRIEVFALSLSFGIKQANLLIRRRDLKFEKGRNPFVPDVQKEAGETVLPYLLLGHRLHPRIPRGIFNRIGPEAGVEDAAELFDRILDTNCTQFLRLAELSETAAPRLGRLLRSLAYEQLKLISSHFGAEEP